MVSYYVIRGILGLYSANCLLVRQRRKKTVDASLPNVKMQSRCNSLTLSERKISTFTSPLETEIIFNKKALHDRFHCIVRWWLLNSAQNIYQRNRRIIELSNQIALILKCVDSVNSKRNFKSVKLLYNGFLNNIISNLSVFLRLKSYLTTFITPLLNSYAVMLTRNCTLKNSYMD